MNELKNLGRADWQENAVMLEQILEVMPDDWFTLRALYETSLTLQHPEKALEMLTRLDAQARASQSEEMIDFVLNQYATIAADSPDVQRRMARLEEIRSGAPLGGQPPAPRAQSSGAAPASTLRLDAEIALAWELFQDEQLTQEEYSSVLHDLTEMSARRMGIPVTVLHILFDRQFPRIERLISFLCQKYSTPLMVPSQYEVHAEVAALLPLEFCSCNGLIPFASIGDDVLVGVLNPADEQLFGEAEALCGRRCHRYLVTPDEYDRHLQRLLLLSE